MLKAIKEHLDEIGIAPLYDADAAVSPSFWSGIEEQTGGRVPNVVKDIYSSFDGFEFPEGAFYFDPRYQDDVMIGWFMNERELAQAFENTRASLADDLLPLVNDGGDNFLAVGIGAHNHGVVVFVIHDAPSDRRVYAVDDSIEHFLQSLHPESTSST